MRIDLETGLLKEAKFVESPNQDERPSNTDIDLLVLHGISLPPGKFGGPFIVDFFCNQLETRVHPFFQTLAHINVSAHLLIRREGEVIQFVPFHKRAWHAGQSLYEGREQCNDFSIGIELEGTDEIFYEDIQYKQLIKITQQIMLAYPKITPDRIVGHSDIAPSRKTDPGIAFDWSFFRKSLKKETLL